MIIMIQFNQVHKKYGDFEALTNVSLTISTGAIHGIVGESGAGKSTLLRMINLLELPDRGEVIVDGVTMNTLNGRKLREIRKTIGMVFQHFHLVSNKTVLQNVKVALSLADVPKKQQLATAMQVLRFVELEHLANQYPAQLSGGQKQRVAIARALATNPKVLLCDEPTSALDVRTTAEILAVLQRINEQFGVTIVIVSHELAVIQSICRQVTVMDKGTIFETLAIQPTGVQTFDSSPERFIEKLKGGE